MTSSGKVRIYELSKDLGLENKDVLDAAEKLSIAAKSHSSSISDDEAAQIRKLIKSNSNGATPAAAAPAQPKAILSLQKAPAPAAAEPAAPRSPAAPAAPARPAPQAVVKPAAPAPRPDERGPWPWRSLQCLEGRSGGAPRTRRRRRGRGPGRG
ncbi:MAG: translation initiation factor IF-2 N-terminal domain-containing protein, partial [Vulcanococcus sp.]